VKPRNLGEPIGSVHGNGREQELPRKLSRRPDQKSYCGAEIDAQASGADSDASTE
jgi:hypothetical protein